MSFAEPAKYGRHFLLLSGGGVLQISLSNAISALSSIKGAASIPNRDSVLFATLNDSFLAWISWKKVWFFFHNFFLFHIKKFPWFSHWKTPLTLIFCQKMLALSPFITFCFWGPVCIANITKLLRILYQISKLFLNFG